MGNSGPARDTTPTHGDSMNRVRSRWIGAQVGWLALLLLAGVPNAGAERLPIRIYTTADGLAHNAVNRIVRDSRGFLWFCTDEGLSRFDGYAFSNFGTDQGLPHASVNDFLETRNGEYWLATGAGLVRFNPTGRPDRRVVYAHGGMSPDAMFIVVLPGDEGWLSGVTPWQCLGQQCHDSGSGTNATLEVPFGSQLLERAQRRRSRHAEIPTQRARRWQSTPRTQSAIQNPVVDVCVQLLEERDVHRGIQRDGQHGSRGWFRHARSPILCALLSGLRTLLSGLIHASGASAR